MTMTSSLSLQPTARTDLRFCLFLSPPVQVIAKYFTFFFYRSMKKVISNSCTQVNWLLSLVLTARIWLPHFLCSLEQKTRPPVSVQEAATNVMLVYMLKLDHLHRLPSHYQFAFLYYVKEELFIFIFKDILLPSLMEYKADCSVAISHHLNLQSIFILFWIRATAAL